MVSVRSRWHLRRERCSWAAEHGRSRGAGPAKGQSYLRTSQGKDWLPNARRGGASRGSAAWYQLGGHSLHREWAVRRPVGTSSGASLFERFCPPRARTRLHRCARRRRRGGGWWRRGAAGAATGAPTGAQREHAVSTPRERRERRERAVSACVSALPPGAGSGVSGSPAPVSLPFRSQNPLPRAPRPPSLRTHTPKFKW